MSHDIEYLKFAKYVLDNGVDKDDRTGTGTKSIFGYQMRFDLQKGFPLLTTKKVHFKSVVHELLWIISGNTNVKYLQDNGVRIWDEWADEDGELGPIYGKQWRRWERIIDNGETEYIDEIDQLKDVINQIKRNPNSRRHLVVTYNPGDIDKMALAPCHAFFQFYVANGKLSCQMYQRSADVFLGVPFNITSYALLTHMIAQVCNLEVGEFIHTIGDGHIYNNHLNQINEQLSRVPYESPKLILNPDIKNINDFKYDDIKLEGYVSHPSIKGVVSV